MTAGLNRRQALAGAATVGIGLPVLAACGAGDPTATDAGGAASGGGPLTTTGHVKVGGGTIFPNEQVVVTQPAAGEFKCFTAVCTHEGCLVSKIADGKIVCECHGSAYSIDDGSVLNPPATSPLAEKAITVAGGKITLS